jgi:pSer/pThr/pTyr-binding forkhead associated (FHA) protein
VTGSAPSLQVDIVDLGSTNGIMVNGQKVRHAVLGEGSRIEIGSTRMLVHAPAGR